MSDLRERLVEALSKPNRTYQTITPKRAVETVWPIIEAELQKRDQEIERLKRRFGPAPRLGGS